MKVKRINKNHIVNNLIEAYLKEHPGLVMLDIVLYFTVANLRQFYQLNIVTGMNFQGYENDYCYLVIQISFMGTIFCIFFITVKIAKIGTLRKFVSLQYMLCD